MNSNEIPAEIVPFLKIILYFAYHVQEVDETQKSLGRYLRPEYLKKVVGAQADDYDKALSWSIEHSHLAYRDVLPDVALSNEDCIKLMGLFRKHIRALPR
ncbi:hypothetical protein [Ralstonia wenshanensis]|uniref:hypothetical protein n=1 Tax=Ralstonia wenshanensis TaxID=2842456 RepID=UPI0039C5D113